MGLEPVERIEAEPTGDLLPLSFIGNQVEPVAVPDLVEPQMMSEAVRHSIRPSARPAASMSLSFVQIALSEPALCSTAPEAPSPA